MSDGNGGAANGGFGDVPESEAAGATYGGGRGLLGGYVSAPESETGGATIRARSNGFFGGAGLTGVYPASAGVPKPPSAPEVRRKRRWRSLLDEEASIVRPSILAG